VIVGIQPTWRSRWCSSACNLEPLRVALDLDAALTLLDRLTGRGARMADEVRVAIADDADLVTARARPRAMAERLDSRDRIRP
jgi:hypothetical protein